MNKLLLLGSAVALSVASLPAAGAMPVASFGSMQRGLLKPVADNPANSGFSGGYYRKYHYGYRHRLYPYWNGRLVSHQARYCPFGSYVACVYGGVYCWDRCY
jgi:hypothetical protein